jgi:chromosome partitioning protein
LIVTFHSYKGGTGKTLLSANLAVIFAKMGKKVAIFDLDFRAPSLHSIFESSNNHWVNDYLNKGCPIEKVLSECNIKGVPKGTLFVALANPSTKAIREMEFKDRKWEIAALGKLLSLKASLRDDMHFDYVFFDASPGYSYSSLNAVFCADVALVVMSADKSETKGTWQMICELYEFFDKKTSVIINKMPTENILSRNHDEYLKINETCRVPIVGVVPCSCEVLRASGKWLFACEKPDHPFTDKLREISAKLERLCNC